MVFIKKNRKYLAVNKNSVASVAAFTFFFLNASVSVVSFVFIGYLLFILCIHFGIFVCAQVCCRFIACFFSLVLRNFCVRLKRGSINWRPRQPKILTFSTNFEKKIFVIVLPCIIFTIKVTQARTAYEWIYT